MHNGQKPNYTPNNNDNVLNDHVLTEQDFYPPSDDRVLESNIEDIDEDNNFVNYCVEFFEMLDEEEYYEN